MVRRFCVIIFLLHGAVSEAGQLIEETVALDASAGSFLLLGEVKCRHAERMEAAHPGRPGMFREACRALERADTLCEEGRPRLYRIWAFCCSMLEDVAACREVGRRAVAKCRGAYWTDALQRPHHVLPGLRASAWHEPAAFPWVQTLERHWSAIRSELDALEHGLDASSWPSVRDHEKSLVQGSGASWTEFPLLGYGEEEEANAKRRCPVTFALLSQIDAVQSHAACYPGQKTAMFSRLTAGTHIKAHCGPMNMHLTCHLGLIVPHGCSLRVGEEQGTWSEGRCLVFDDSFEHEVWHPGASDRTVLLFRFWHPDIPAAERQRAVREHQISRTDKSYVLL